MAGETPGARRARRAQKMSWQDNRSTDKYYRSGQESVIAPEGSYPPEEELVGNPTNKCGPDERNADKKYYASAKRGKTPEQVALEKARNQRAVKKGAPPPRRSGELVVRTKEDIIPVLEDLKSNLSGGAASL